MVEDCTKHHDTLSIVQSRRFFALLSVVPAMLSVFWMHQSWGDSTSSNSTQNKTIESMNQISKDATQVKLERAVEADPLHINSRWQLCEHLEGVFQQSKHRMILPDVLSCYNKLWSAILSLRETAPDHPRRRWLEHWQRFAHIVGDKHVVYAEAHRDRYHIAAQHLWDAVADESYCNNSEQTVQLALNPRRNTDSCIRSFAILLLALRAAGAPWDEVEKAYVASQRLLNPPSWVNPRRIHLQREGFRTMPIWDTTEFPWISELELRSQDIKRELQDSLANINFGSTQGTNVELLADGDAWTNIRLYDHLGRWNETLCARFPVTCGLLRGRPELDRKRFRRAADGSFSLPPLGVNFYRLSPGKAIGPHFGAHSRLVASLGLEVSSMATLRVGDVETQWQEGKAVVFDDSFEHEVINKGSEVRIVLAVVFLHPDAHEPV